MAKQALNLKYDILQVSQLASAAKAKNNSVINGTVGVLYNEEGKIWSINTVDHILKNLNDSEFYNYSPLDGGSAYKEAVKNWVFGESRSKIEENLCVEVVATPGGTGALVLGLALSLNEHENLLLPDVCWPPYKGMALNENMHVIEYNYIKNNHFDLDAFKSYASSIMTVQKKLVTILNDPCNNPTGLSLTNEEFSLLIDFLNSLNGPVTLILDIAYFDYYIDGMDEARNRLELLTNIKEHITVIIAHSCSKSFSLYGLRVGSTIIINKNNDVVKSMQNESCIYGRTHWSSVSRPGISLLSKVDQNHDLKDTIVCELEEVENTVKRRAALFTKEAKEVNLDIYPYGGGFFISVKCENTTEAFEKLMKEDIYLIPISNVLRVAICSISERELHGLAKRIKNIIS